ncbi:cache domain-containing protein [Candidatus Palauibacter sp.]|uniref:cache domain-containing protein n=1 Tax=Candidatus Palauibacter sp. TaxID=3101350 RepID=UPI003B5A1D7F
MTHRKRTLDRSTLAALCIVAASAAACSSSSTEPSPAAPITAADVMDRATLKAFVDRAVAETERQAGNRNEAYAFFDAVFRPVGEWNRDSIYLWVYELDGTCFFNAVNPHLETRYLWELEDRNGIKIIQALTAVAINGGGYVDYLWENPAVPGDEEEGSHKVGYAVLVDAGPDRFMIGSGIYP